MELKIKSCSQCPFANRDNEYGLDSCNHPESKIELKNFEQLPFFSIHPLCPLRISAILVGIANFSTP
jgi:hypothetical protein